ncbi:fimbrial protein [Pseudomonas sp. Irchel 3H7]|uniref:fimbrial protein n=1 Tax=Pseudomonas sp. Irchel 3H7 TaxID=2009042 RepID=UPI000BA3A1B5|nr:fimbrial protein [Pseudomonas sp. Irchel 3H7]
MRKSLYWFLISPILFVFTPFVNATCSFDKYSGLSETTINLPVSLSASRDLPVGAEVWSSGWVKSPSTLIRCTGSGFIQGTLASGIGAAIPGYTGGGFSSVFETNVPGLGISVYLCSNVPTGCGTDFSSLVALANLNTPLTDTYVPLVGSWLVRLIKVGPISSSIPLQIPGVSSGYAHGLETGRLMLSGQMQINTIGCEITSQSRNITVSLPSVMLADFSDDTTILNNRSKSQAFEISLMCDAGTRLRYQIDGVESSSAYHVLANAQGSGMATGIGVQLFRGDFADDDVVPLGISLLHANVESNSRVVIPLMARYYKTAARVSEMRAGQVTVAATFTLSYE